MHICISFLENFERLAARTIVLRKAFAWRNVMHANAMERCDCSCKLLLWDTTHASQYAQTSAHTAWLRGFAAWIKLAKEKIYLGESCPNLFFSQVVASSFYYLLADTSAAHDMKGVQVRAANSFRISIFFRGIHFFSRFLFGDCWTCDEVVEWLKASPNHG